VPLFNIDFHRGKLSINPDPVAPLRCLRYSLDSFSNFKIPSPTFPF
jgi:hypothetical protein